MAGLLGRTGTARAYPELTGAQAATLIDTFGASKGLAPGSPGGTVKYLRADGTWVEPPGGAGTEGPPGAQGFPGEDGEDGIGYPGAAGAPGATGAAGPEGRHGSDGSDGEDGIGWPGTPGATGATGVAGPLGFPGEDGEDAVGWPGAPGVPGATGAAGAAGAAGPLGFPGEDGEDAVGWPGPAGATGPAGGGGGSATTVEVNLGALPGFWAGSFLITDAAIGASSKVLAWQHAGPYTGKGTLAGEAAFAPVHVLAVAPAAGQARVYWETPPVYAVAPLGARNNTASVSLTRAEQKTTEDALRRVNRVSGNVKFNYLVFA